MFVCATCGQRYPGAGFCAADGAPLAATDDPLHGSEIGRYRIARTLGEGGMGTVYLAVQPAIGSRVAIKLLSEQCAQMAELVERFFAEARAVNLIRHENIVGVLDMARLADGRPFIVMEFVEGQTLAEIVRSTVAPLGGVVQVMGEVLAALGAAHAIGIVHRDLKPDNILVTVEGHAKVLDFGIAKLAPNLRDAGSATRTGALLGTPAYMAPEQISGAASVDGRTDVYAAGVVLFEAVTGQQPFHGSSMFELMRAHVEQPPPAPSALRPDLPPAIEQIILTALAKDPEERFQSAAAMAQALAHASSGLGAAQWRALSSSRTAAVTPRLSGGGMGAQPTPRATPPPRRELHRSYAVAPTTPAAPPRSRLGRKLALAAAVLLALGIVGAVAITQRSGGGEVVAAGSGSDRAAAGGSGGAALLSTATPTSSSPASGPPSPGSGPPSPGSGPPSPGSGPSSPGSDRSPAGTVAAHGRATIARAGSAPPTQPTIIGGGSAADHGVFAGANVQLGPGVVIGGATPAPRRSLSQPADYDPKHFDPVAYLPKAERLARQLLPDAKLTSFEFDPVWPDGHVDLTVPGQDRAFEFRSVAASARPADLPRNVPFERACMVHVELAPTTVTVELHRSDTCDAPLVRRPSCHLAGIWQQAIAAGTGRDVVARIAWLKDESWFFDTDLDGRGGTTSSFPDRCR